MRKLYRLGIALCIVLLLTLSALGIYTGTQAAATKTPLPTKTPKGAPAADTTSVGMLAVLVYDNGGNTLYLVDTAGKNLKQLDVSPNATTNDLAWSPDGNYLAFINDHEQVMLINLDGSNPQPAKGIVGRGFAWTPDSKQLTFEQDALLTSVDIATGQPHPIFALRKIQSDIVTGLRWSADGKHVLFILTTDTGPKLHVVDVSSRDDQALDTAVVPSGAMWDPVASEANKLAYFGVGGGKAGIFIYDITSKTTTPMFSSYTFVSPVDWSPDGKQFVYDVRSMGLSVIDVSNHKVRPLPLPPALKGEITAIAWRPASTASVTGTMAATMPAATMAPTTGAASSQSTVAASDGSPAALTQTFVASDKSVSFMYPVAWGAPQAQTIGDPGGPSVTIAGFSSPNGGGAIFAFIPAKFSQMATQFLGTTDTPKKTQLKINGLAATRVEGNLRTVGGPGVAYSLALGKGDSALIAARGTADVIKQIDPLLQAILATVRVPAASG